MTLAFIAMSVMAGGLFGYNEFIRDVPTVPMTAQTQERSVPLVPVRVNDPVVDYIKEWAGSRNRTEARKYARTEAVLGQCGFRFRGARKTYEAENQANYNILKTRIVPGGSVPQTQVRQVASNEINADMFKLDIATTSGNSMLAAGAMAQELENPFPEASYKERPSAEACNLVKSLAAEGKLKVRI